MNISLKKAKILFLGASPVNEANLSLTRELNGIQAELRATDLRDRFELVSEFEVEAKSLPGLLLRHKPTIVHFSGHGEPGGELLFQDRAGRSHPVDPRTIAEVFRLHAKTVNCVVLNACYAESQAREIAKYVDVIIGMRSAISDRSAISFAAGFYEALAYGCNALTAFESAKLRIDLERLDHAQVPVLLTRAGLDPSLVHVLEGRAPVAPRPPPNDSSSSSRSRARRRTTKPLYIHPSAAPTTDRSRPNADLREESGTTRLRSPALELAGPTQARPQGPGLGYDPAWHVTHLEEEEWTLNAIIQGGEPIAVCAPLHYGKSWFVKRVLALLEQRAPALARSYVDLSAVERTSLETLLKAIGTKISQDVGLEIVDWPLHGEAQSKLLEVLEVHIKPRVPDGMILCLDLPDEMWEFPDRDEFFGLMRALSGQSDPERWRWLRVMLAFSMSPSLFIDSITRSPWNSPEVRLDEFSREQVQELAGRHGLHLSSRDMELLWQTIGGHPYMVRHALYEVVRTRRTLQEILRDGSLDFHLHRLENLLTRNDSLCESLCKLMAGHRIDQRHRRRLEAAGVVRWDESAQRYVPRFPIYGRLLRSLCR
jgi:hypothetical protein